MTVGVRERCGIAGALFPASVATAETSGEEESPPLYPEEEAAVARAAARRRREFRAGRVCARAALRALGHPPCAIPVGPDRAPLWPEGVVGSITHTRGLCAAAVARRRDAVGLGLDAERRGAVRRELLARICTEEELAWMERTPAPPGGDWPTLVFSAKESVYKAVQGAGGLEGTPGFHAAALPVPPAEGAFRVELRGGRWPAVAPGTLRGRYAFAPGHVLTGVWLPPPELGRGRP